MEGAAPRIYIGNLRWVAQKADIERLLADNDIIFKNIDISIDPFTGRNPSYCFVDLSDHHAVEHAIRSLQGQIVRSRSIKVNHHTQRRSQSDISRRPTIVYNRSARGREVPTPNVNPRTSYVYYRWSRDDAPERWTAPLEEGRRLWIGGLPRIPNQDVLNEVMKDLFHDYNIEAVSKLIPPSEESRKKRRSRFYCYVDVATAQEAEDAEINLDGNPTPYRERYVVRVAGLPKRPTKVMREQLGVSATPVVTPQRNLEGNWQRMD